MSRNEYSMTPEKLKEIIATKEGTEIEFKTSQESLSRSVYESICAFLNRRGGHIVLGVNNDRKIVGINPDKVQEQLDTLAKDMNSSTRSSNCSAACLEPLMSFWVPLATVWISRNV